MSKHKKQHFVAQCYLRAWCDPKTPTEQEPYVWRFSKDGTNARRKAPENIFHETDLYTITMPDGERDLRLEQGLSQLEGEFVKIRDLKLAREEPFEARDHSVLCPSGLARRAWASASEAAVSDVRARDRAPLHPDRASPVLGLAPWQLWSTIEWCGHRVEGIPAPDGDGRWRLIVVEGEAR